MLFHVRRYKVTIPQVGPVKAPRLGTAPAAPSPALREASRAVADCGFESPPAGAASVEVPIFDLREASSAEADCGAESEAVGFAPAARIGPEKDVTMTR